MRFCPWYPLDDAAAHAPAAAGVLQIRTPDLLDYPSGKSAMVHYELADDVRAAAVALASSYAGRGWLCRHLIEIADDDLAAFHARLLRDFRARFGSEPSAGGPGDASAKREPGASPRSGRQPASPGANEDER